MLKYLFKAFFEDGTVIEQNPADMSAVNPDKSCFFDVLDKQSRGAKLSRFELHGPGIYSVDLNNGAFRANDSLIVLAPEGLNLTNFRLVYFRRNTLQFAGQSKVGHDVSYFTGWQANDENGKNIQSVMEIT
jgi:hypothetical protein